MAITARPKACASSNPFDQAAIGKFIGSAPDPVPIQAVTSTDKVFSGTLRGKQAPITFTLPPERRAQVDEQAYKLPVSREAFIKPALSRAWWQRKCDITLRCAFKEIRHMQKLLMQGLVTLALLFSTLSVLAQDGLALDAPPPSGDVRRTIAKQLASEFMTLDRQIPTLSPSQARWLQTEYKDEIAYAGNRYTPRAIAAMDSLEYQIFIVKPRNAAILETFTRIATGNVQDKNHEIALWSSAASWFVDFQYWQAVKRLVERGAVQKKIGHVDDFYFENYTTQAQAVLLKIVIPYLEGRLP